MEIDANGGSGQPGTPADAHAGAPDGSNAQGGDFLSVLDEDTRGMAEARGWTSPDKFPDAIKSFRSLEQKLGSALTVPGEDATPEDRQAFLEKASQTWTPENGYEFKMPEGLDENFAYDQEFAGEAGNWFKEIGLHPSQAQFLHDKWIGKQAEVQKQMAEAAQEAQTKRETAASEAHQGLIKEYGAVDSPGYQNAVAKAAAVSDKYPEFAALLASNGGLSEPDEAGQRQVLNAGVVHQLARLHTDLFGEDNLLGESAKTAKVTG